VAVVRKAAVVPAPSWPSLLRPHARPVPSERLMARLWIPPQAMAATVMPPRAGAGTGRLVVSPVPSWPKLLSPQASTVSSEATAVATAPTGRVTATGVELLVVVPLPSWPKLLRPQVETVPAAVRATLWKVPPATEITPALSGEAAPVATVLGVVVALQSWPYPLEPVARTDPPAGAWVQRAKAWVSVPGVAWPPDWTMLLHDVGAGLPSATGEAAA